MKPQARKARSERALPAATWAQHHSPAGTHARPAAIRSRPAPDDSRRRVEQLDRQLASADETAPEDHDTGGVDDHLDVASVAQRSLYSRMVGDDRIEFGRWLRRTTDTTSGQHDVDGADLPVAFGQPVQHVWMERPAEAVGAESRTNVTGGDVGEHEGVPGHRHHGPCPVGVRRQDLDTTVSGRETGPPPPARGSPPTGGPGAPSSRYAAGSWQNAASVADPSPLAWTP